MSFRSYDSFHCFYCSSCVANSSCSRYLESSLHNLVLTRTLAECYAIAAGAQYLLTLFPLSSSWVLLSCRLLYYSTCYVDQAKCGASFELRLWLAMRRWRNRQRFCILLHKGDSHPNVTYLLLLKTSIIKTNVFQMKFFPSSRSNPCAMLERAPLTSVGT